MRWFIRNFTNKSCFFKKLYSTCIQDITKGNLGKFKDELGGRIMTKFVGLRSKTCAYLIYDFQEEKRKKG